MSHIGLRDVLVAKEHVFSIFRECTPKLLVVTDGLNYSASSGFGLTQFVQTLRGSTIHGMTPIVKTASRANDPNADLPGFDFTDATNGLLKGRYDVVFLLGIARENEAQLPQAQVDAIARFMQAGGGVFATGDHEDLGASLSRDIPRVRAMRYWTTGTPDVGDTTRLSTNLAGDDGVYQFEDQSDRVPQRLYPNYRTRAGGIGNAHPLLQDGSLAIEVFPDHPHEGECLVPEDLTTTFAVDATTRDEWPAATGGGTRVSPEMVALTMSAGDAFPGKEALVPRSFIAVAAYDGQRAGIGRVVTDATWHHFVNVNLDGTGSGRGGLRDAMGNDTPDLKRIRQYYRNLAGWLMPANTRRCLRIPRLVLELERYPLFEELRVPDLERANGEQLRAAGAKIAAAMRGTATAWEAEAMLRDALTDATGAAGVDRLEQICEPRAPLSLDDAGHAALGGLATAAIARVVAAAGMTKVDPHKFFPDALAAGAKLGFERYVADQRQRLRDADKALAALGG
jgi:hypothetical protein